MKTDNQQTLRADRVWLSEEACDLDDFRGLAERRPCLPITPRRPRSKKTS